MVTAAVVVMITVMCSGMMMTGINEDDNSSGNDGDNVFCGVMTEG